MTRDSPTSPVRLRVVTCPPSVSVPRPRVGVVGQCWETCLYRACAHGLLSTCEPLRVPRNGPLTHFLFSVAIRFLPLAKARSLASAAGRPPVVTRASWQGCRASPGAGAHLIQELSWEGLPAKGQGGRMSHRRALHLLCCSPLAKARQGWLPFAGTPSVWGGRYVNIGRFKVKLVRNLEAVTTMAAGRGVTHGHLTGSRFPSWIQAPTGRFRLSLLPSLPSHGGLFTQGLSLTPRLASVSASEELVWTAVRLPNSSDHKWSFLLPEAGLL